MGVCGSEDRAEMMPSLYCFNCDSMFCVACDKSHSKFAKDHRVVYGDDMPVYDSGDKQAFVPCKVHSMENIDLYCEEHEEAICNVCKHTSHRKCDVQAIESAFAFVDVSEFRNGVTTHIAKLLAVAEETDINTQSWLEKANENKDEMDHKISYLKTEIISVCDRYLQQLSAQHTSKTDLATSNSRVCKSINAHLTHEKDKMESSKGISFRELLKLIETNKHCKEYTAVLDDMKKESLPAEYVITEDDNIASLIQQISDIGHKKVTDSDEAAVDAKDTPKKESFVNIKECSHVQEEDIQMINDTQSTSITGCCFMSNGGIALCDNTNDKVKFLDKDMKIYYSFPCAKPWDVDSFSESIIVVTTPDAKSIQYIYIKPGIKTYCKVDIGYRVYGVHVSVNNKTTFVVIADNEKQRYGIQILKGYGTKLRFINHTGTGQPRYICTNIDGSKLYYSGRRYTSVFVNCMTQTEFGLYTIHTSSMKESLTLMCDDDENLIACDRECIHVIDSQGVVCGTVLPEKDSYLQSMCLDKANGILIVASGKDKIVKLTAYKLKYDL